MGEDNLGIELISKDGIINALIPIMSELSIDDNAQGKIFLTIMNQKVAYDVEKVVAKMKDRVENHDCIKCKHYDDEKYVCNVEKSCRDYTFECLYDIVKAGGVE